MTEEKREDGQVLRMQRVRPEARLPERATAGSAGYDLRACILEPVEVPPGGSVVLPTGLAAQIPEGLAGLIFTRSGLGIRHGIVVTNGVGVIDSDYRGEIRVGLTNLSQTPYTVAPGERVAQMILMPYFALPVVEAETLDGTARGTGGFGSTGTA